MPSNRRYQKQKLEILGACTDARKQSLLVIKGVRMKKDKRKL